MAPHSHLKGGHRCFFIGAVNLLQSAETPEDIYVVLWLVSTCDSPRLNSKEGEFPSFTGFVTWVSCFLLLFLEVLKDVEPDIMCAFVFCSQPQYSWLFLSCQGIELRLSTQL